MLRLPRRQGPSTSNFHNCSTSSGMGAYRSGFAYVVLSPLSLDFYYTNTGIQTNWWDDRRFMVGMRVFLVGHVRSTQWSWIKSSMSNRSSKSRQAPPSPLGCIRKSAGHLLTLRCPQKPWGDKSRRQWLDCHWQTIELCNTFFRIQLHEHEQYMITSFGCLPARYTTHLTASMAWLSLPGWPLSKQETIGAAPALDMDAGRAINTRCLLFSNFTLARVHVLRALPFRASRAAGRHRSTSAAWSSSKIASKIYRNVVYNPTHLFGRHFPG